MGSGIVKATNGTVNVWWDGSRNGFPVSKKQDGVVDGTSAHPLQTTEKAPMDGDHEDLVPAFPKESGIDLTEQLQLSWAIRIPALTCILFFTRKPISKC